MSGKFEPGRFAGHEPAGDVWRHTLARIPTLFGRVLYLASLRDPGTGAYQHHTLAQVVGDEEAADTLRRSHLRVFEDWLSLSLEQQKADIEEYLIETGNPAGTIAQWNVAGAYAAWVPPAAQDVERRLFLGDLETLLNLLKRQYPAASPDSES